MKPKRIHYAAFLALLLGVFFGLRLYGQSLADLARQERARKGQEAKAGKVYTNEDIPAARIGGEAPAAAPAGGETQKPGEPAATKPAEGEAGKPTPTPAQARAAQEKEYRDKFAKLRETLAYEERRLDVLQRELNLAQQQYYSDPNVAMREQNTRDEINRRTAELEAQRGVVEKAKQAITDLETELQRKNLPPGWAR